MKVYIYKLPTGYWVAQYGSRIAYCINWKSALESAHQFLKGGTA